MSRPQGRNEIILQAIVGLLLFAVGSDIWTGSTSHLVAIAGISVMSLGLVTLTWRPQR